MGLSLPEDVTTLSAGGVDPYQSAGVYLLELSKPEHPTRAWDAEYDTRPEWFTEWRDAERVVYVGGAKCVMSRLEDHRDSHDPEKDAVRQTVLTPLSTDIDLLEVYWYDDADTAFLKESQHALHVDQQTAESTFVRQA